MTLRIWDLFFAEGPSVLFRAALTIFHLNEKRITSAGSLQELSKGLQEFSNERISADTFVIIMQTMNLRRTSIQNLRRAHGSSIKAPKFDRAGLLIDPATLVREAAANRRLARKTERKRAQLKPGDARHHALTPTSPQAARKTSPLGRRRPRTPNAVVAAAAAAAQAKTDEKLRESYNAEQRSALRIAPKSAAAAAAAKSPLHKMRRHKPTNLLLSPTHADETIQARTVHVEEVLTPVNVKMDLVKVTTSPRTPARTSFAAPKSPVVPEKNNDKGDLEVSREQIFLTTHRGERMTLASRTPNNVGAAISKDPKADPNRLSMMLSPMKETKDMDDFTADYSVIVRPMLNAGRGRYGDILEDDKGGNDEDSGKGHRKLPSKSGALIDLQGLQEVLDMEAKSVSTMALQEDVDEKVADDNDDIEDQGESAEVDKEQIMRSFYENPDLQDFEDEEEECSQTLILVSQHQNRILSTGPLRKSFVGEVDVEDDDFEDPAEQEEEDSLEARTMNDKLHRKPPSARDSPMHSPQQEPNKLPTPATTPVAARPSPKRIPVSPRALLPDDSPDESDSGDDSAIGG